MHEFFFFQAEDGIRDYKVTGVQTCALPISNHSVRVTDDFMRAVAEDKDWWTKNVIDGQPNEKLRARDLMMKIADSTWRCGDPGMQYDTTVNRWHTAKNTARINASNPCSEYMFLDDTACNLASLNLMKYV